MTKKLEVLSVRNCNQLKEVKAHRVTLREYPELPLYAYFGHKIWWIIEKSTGLTVVSPSIQNCTTLDYAIASAHESIHKFGVPCFHDAVAMAIKSYGAINQ